VDDTEDAFTKPKREKRDQKGKVKATGNNTKRDSKVLASLDDADWLMEGDVSDDGGLINNKGGRKTNPVLLLVSRICRRAIKPGNALGFENIGEAAARSQKLIEKATATANTMTKQKGKKSKDPDLHVRCIGSVGCKTTWATPRSQLRVFAHVKSCKWVPFALRKQVMAQMSDGSLGDKVEVMDAEEDEVSGQEGSGMDGGSDLDGTGSDSDQPHAKRQKSLAVGRPSGSKSVYDLARQSGKQQFKNRADFALLLFLCCNCLPPYVVDSRHFKQLVKVLHPWYKPPHSSTIADNLVPTEATRVRGLQIAYLKTCRDLSISFDGGKIRRPRSVYTVNVTTPDRRSFLVEGDDASNLSHTGKYNAELLEEVGCQLYLQNYLVMGYLQTILEIGPGRFSAASADNTGNTRVGRSLTHDRWPWILNLQDPCHKLSLTCKDVCKLDEFHDVSYSWLQ